MAKKIKVTQTSPPTKREVGVKCPSCNSRLTRHIPIGQKEGNDRCGICGAGFHWKEM